MSEKIASNILTAIDILTDKKIAEARFDRTINATVIKCQDSLAGEYLVKYQDAEIIAYSGTSDPYAAGDLVYVTVP
jgi:hypothetical protein